MVELTSDFRSRARRQFEKALRAKPWVTKIAWRVYRVRGRFVGTGTYTVTFSVDSEGRRFGHCTCPAGEPRVDRLTGLPTHEPMFCYHLSAAYLRHLINARRRARTEGSCQNESTGTLNSRRRSTPSPFEATRCAA
jgi:hypothetical protein